MQDRSAHDVGVSPTRTAKVIPMSSAAKALEFVEEIAGPQPLGAKLKKAFGDVADATGLTARRIRAIWNREAKLIDADELATLERAALMRRYETRRKRNEARNDLIAFAADFSSLAERAARLDPEMVGPWSDAMLEIARRARSMADGDGQ